MNNLVIYPEYPERIKRNYDYSVKVTQGDKSAVIPVYNELRQASTTREPWGDDYRRFAEFAFDGEPVRVDITVNMSFADYTLMPAIANLKSNVKGNVITVYIDKPQYFMIRLGDKVNTMLAIFADAPETDIPDKNENGVTYIDSWFDTDDGFLHIGSNETVYIAPGAVCNARILADGENIKICGRGMVRDPFDVRTHNKHGETYVVNFTNAVNPVVRGIKICDCRFYHLYFGDSKNILVENVKLLSNAISNDGFLVVRPDTMTIRNCYADIGDDVFTIANGENFKPRNLYYENIICGSTCGIFSFVNIKDNVKFKNISIFKCDESMFKNYYTNLENTPFGGVEFEDIWAVDCVFIPTFFESMNQGDAPKYFKYKNVSIIKCSSNIPQDEAFNKRHPEAICIRNGSGFKFDLENIFIDGEICRLIEQIGIDNRTDKFVGIQITADQNSSKHIPKFANKTVLDTPYIAPQNQIVPVAADVNLVPAGDFENGVGPWVTQNFAPLALSKDAHSGKYSLYLPCEKTWCGTSISIREAIMKHGKGTYRVSFWAKKDKSTVLGHATAAYGIKHGTPTQDEAMPTIRGALEFDLTDDWTQYQYDINVDFDTAETGWSLIIFRNSTNDGTANFYIDDVTMNKIN